MFSMVCSTIVFPLLLVSARAYQLRKLTTTSNKLNKIKYTSEGQYFPFCIRWFSASPVNTVTWITLIVHVV